MRYFKARQSKFVVTLVDLLQGRGSPSACFSQPLAMCEAMTGFPHGETSQIGNF